MRRKKRSLVRGDKVFMFGPPPPRRKPVIDRSMPSTWEQYLDDRKNRERDAQQRADELDGQELDGEELDGVVSDDTLNDVNAAVALLDAAFGGASVRDALGETDGGDEADETNTDGGDAVDRHGHVDDDDRASERTRS